jgi:hypothetical protein
MQLLRSIWLEDDEAGREGNIAQDQTFMYS